MVGAGCEPCPPWPGQGSPAWLGQEAGQDLTTRAGEARSLPPEPKSCTRPTSSLRRLLLAVLSSLTRPNSVQSSANKQPSNCQATDYSLTWAALIEEGGSLWPQAESNKVINTIVASSLFHIHIHIPIYQRQCLG